MDHINDKVNKAYGILGIIKRNFIHLHINSGVTEGAEGAVAPGRSI